MACEKCFDVPENAALPFTDQCVQYFWNKLPATPSGYQTALDKSVSYNVFYCLPGKSRHARLVFSDDGVNGFTIELFVDGVPEPQMENVTELRVCLQSKWFKKDARWVPIPEIGINASRHNLYLYAIEFMKEFGTHYNKINHNCQDFILWFLRSLGIPKPFRTAMGKLKLAGKIALCPVVASAALIVGACVTLASPIAIPIVLWDNLSNGDLSQKATVFTPFGVVLVPAAAVYGTLLEESPEELEQNRKRAKSVGINLVGLQCMSEYEKFFSFLYWVAYQNFFGKQLLV